MKLVKHQNRQANLSNLPVTKLLSFVFWFSVMLLCSSLFPFISNVSKNYMFLLCNGILVVIVKNSGLMGNSHQDMNLMKKKGSYPQKAVEFPAEMKTPVVEDEKVVMEVKEMQEVEPMSLIVVKGGRNAPLITQEGEDDIATSDKEIEEEVESMSLIVVKGARNTLLITPQGEEEEEEEGEGGSLSAEELNKKCDDFIRMMKQQIFEAQQHILVQH